MTHEELSKREKRAATETLVIQKTDEGFRVFAPTNPARQYIVSGIPDDPACSCPDFEVHAEDPDWRCKHILAVMRRGETPAPPRGNEDRPTNGGRQAPDNESRRSRRTKRVAPGNGASQMVLKRSVSPDGRIDSLSVEVSCPIEGVTDEEAEDRARKAMALQSAIANGFLNGRKNERDERTTEKEPEDETVPARITGVGGMDGRYGRRLYLTVQSNGKALRLFGNRKQLGDHLAAAGYTKLADRIEEGFRFDVPCRIVTEPTPDGRYLNITEVLPAENRRHEGRAR